MDQVFRNARKGWSNTGASHIRAVFFGLGLALAVLAHSEARSADDGRLVFIVHSTVSLDDLSTADLKSLYLGDTTTIQGQSLRPVGYAAGNPLRITFERQVLGMSSEQFAEHWRSKRFLGSYQKQPTSFKSAQAVKRFVAEERDAIGYIPLSEVDSSVHPVRRLNAIPLEQQTYLFRESP